MDEQLESMQKEEELKRVSKELKKEFESILIPDLKELLQLDRDRIRNLFRRSEVVKDLRFGVNKITELTGIKYNFDSILKECEEKVKEFKLPLKESIKLLTNRKTQAEYFFNYQPIHYDKSCLWWLWNNSNNCWEIMDEVDILNIISESTDADVISSQSRQEILNSLKQIGRKNIPKQSKESWIQFRNMIVDINTNEEFMATSEYFITNPIPWEIGDFEETPTMDKIFEQWVGKNYVKTLYEIIAYSMLPDYPLHRLFCLIGDGLNGKSCYLKLLRKFLGYKNVISTELDILLNSRFEISKLHKKLVCMLGETDFAEISKTSILKKLTGGDLIGYEYKNKNPFDDINYAKIIIATNNLPTTSDKTIGFYRRWLIIDFSNKFNEDINILNSIPEEEYNNLAKKSIRILNDLLKYRKFTNDGSVEERMKRYESKSNPFDKFWEECIEEYFSDWIFKKEFREKLDIWCNANRFRKLSDVVISNHIKEKGISDGRHQANWFTKEGERPTYSCWEGIKWKL